MSNVVEDVGSDGKAFPCWSSVPVVCLEGGFDKWGLCYPLGLGKAGGGKV